MYREHNQMDRTLLNRARAYLSFDEWDSIRCHDCKAERLVRQDPVIDATPAAIQPCESCGSSKTYPVGQRTAMFCEGCDNDLVHQSNATVERTDDGTHEFTCGYCGTNSEWLTSPPAPVRLDRD